jgi:hypothetical protein
VELFADGLRQRADAVRDARAELAAAYRSVNLPPVDVRGIWPELDVEERRQLLRGFLGVVWVWAEHVRLIARGYEPSDLSVPGRKGPETAALDDTGLEGEVGVALTEDVNQRGAAPPEADPAKPLPVALILTPGPRYRIGQILLHAEPAEQDRLLEQAAAELRLAEGDPARPADILAAEEALRRVTMSRLLAHGIGTVGMAGGQAIDLESVGRTLDLAHLQDMHRRKTGALIETSVMLGATAAGVLDGPVYEALRAYGSAIGLAFQIQDDILDVTGTTASIGKVAGADAAHHKPTYISLMGLPAAQAEAAMLRDRALRAIEDLGEAREDLAALADFVVGRAS